MRTIRLLLCVSALAPLFGIAADETKPTSPAWKAGAAAVDITPEGPVWLAGFGDRTKPSEGTPEKIYIKALALEDALGTQMVFVTMDLVTIRRATRDAVAQKLFERHQLPPESLLVNVSHTHSAPAPYPNYVRDPVLAEKARAYGQLVEAKMVEVAGAALAALQPAELSYTHGKASFATNRRVVRPATNFIHMLPNPEGPVDHDVPVLAIKGADGKMKAILFGYACHNTAGYFYNVNGDYAGFAQKFLEERYPGAVALFMQGAGGDQNANPRFLSMDQVAQHGHTLANAVEGALDIEFQKKVNGPLRSALGYAELNFMNSSRMDLERRSRSKDKADQARAKRLLQQLDAGETLPTSYPCPVQVVRFGLDLTMVAIGGETTVDYSLRLKRELGGTPRAIWVAGYNNDIFGYLGSKRVILEGGYEGYSSGLNRYPGPWAISTEDRVIEKVYEMIAAVNH